MISIININSNNILAKNAIYAKTFLYRLRGLIFRRDFNRGECLIIVPCKMIHTFGMKFPIDIVFISKDHKVVYIMENLLPMKVSPFITEAYGVLELPRGTIRDTGTKIGDMINIIE